MSQLRIDLNQLLEAQAAQVQREREQPTPQPLPPPNGIDDIFRELNPAGPTSQLSSETAVTVAPSAQKVPQGEYSNPTPSGDLLDEVNTTQTPRGATHSATAAGNPNSNILND